MPLALSKGTNATFLPFHIDENTALCLFAMALVIYTAVIR